MSSEKQQRQSPVRYFVPVLCDNHLFQSGNNLWATLGTSALSFAFPTRLK